MTRSFLMQVFLLELLYFWNNMPKHVIANYHKQAYWLFSDHQPTSHAKSDWFMDKFLTT